MQSNSKISIKNNMEYIISLRKSGLTYREIEEITGIHKSTLQYNLVTWGIEKPHSFEDNKKQIMEMRANGVKIGVNFSKGK